MIHFALLMILVLLLGYVTVHFLFSSLKNRKDRGAAFSKQRRQRLNSGNDGQPRKFCSDGSGSKSTSRYPRLSRPVSLMRPEYDVVVIGSGYGGAVAASRMARAGKTVAILELGRERWPGEYPSKLIDARPEFYISGHSGFGSGLLKRLSGGKVTSMYHLIQGEGQNVFIAHGLGGTSLVNANVFLRADRRTLAQSQWPPEIREDPSSLDKYYAHAEHMLQPMPYPSSQPSPEKLKVFEKQAKALDQEQNFYRVPQTTFFHMGHNHAGVEMKASTGSGQDCTGINDGSKNSTLMNYIPDAWNHGAEIFCECEVRYIRKDPNNNGYTIFFVWHGEGRSKFGDVAYNQLIWVRAKELCFLGAGTLGTTEILLRSEAHGLYMSPLVGQKISGNGDMLSFAYNSDRIINGLGRESPSRSETSGPTITGIIDNRGSEVSPNVLDSYVIQEGAIPEALAPVIEGLLEYHNKRKYPSRRNILARTISRIKTMVFGPYATGCSVNRTQPFLIMSHDSSEGILTMTNDKPHMQFLGIGEIEPSERLYEVLSKASNAISGTLINSPAISVHPLGGARMSKDGTGSHGVVNHIGQLLIGDGPEVYDGIVCVDASVVPGSLGINPLATITALAERSCDFLIRKYGWTVNETPNGRLDLLGKPARSITLRSNITEKECLLNRREDSYGLHFTELMEGFIYIGIGIEDFIMAERVAKGSGSLARLHISVDIPNVEKLEKRAGHMASAMGTFSCRALSPETFLILSGKVNFFAKNDSIADATSIVYSLKLLSTEGETYTLEGYKSIGPEIAFSPRKTWAATTTLYTTITRQNGSVVGRGILRISLNNFLTQMRTFNANDQTTFKSRIIPPFRFVYYFLKNVFNYFLGPFRTLQYPDTNTTGYFSKPSPTLVTLTSGDGVQTTLKIWEPKPNVPTKSMPILFIPGASVDDRMFSLPTIRTNAIDYFTSLGYRSYVAVMRFGITPVAEEGWTAFDTRWDVKAAMEYVREKEKGKKFYVICHCLGSITTSIALLTGTVNKEWIQGMTSSQVFFNLRFSTDNQFKGSHPILMKAYEALAGSWFPISKSSPTSSFIQRLIDQILRFYPIGANSELCSSTVCHRNNLVFGRCFTHSHLNAATHQHLASFFSGIHTNFLTHLSRMGAVSPHHVRTNLASSTSPSKPDSFADLVGNENLENLRGLKICFLSGGANVVFDPLSTLESYLVLKKRSEDVERIVVKGYGHLDCWMGKDSARDVFPRVRSHIEKCECIERARTDMGKSGGRDINTDATKGGGAWYAPWK